MIDQVIVVLYFLVTLFIGLYAGRNTKTIEDFAIGPRNFSTIVLVSTIFASVVDAGMTTGLASSTYSIGPIFLISFLGIIFSHINVSFFIAPRMKQFLGLISSGDIFEKLYGKKAKTLMGCSTIIESTLTAAIQIFAISQIGQYFFGMPPLVSSAVVSLLIVLYTFRGGIRSVTATEVFQFGIMIIAIPIMCGVALYKFGGIQSLSQLLQEHPLYFTKENNENHLEYLAVFISFSLPCLYPLCIQRMLMAKNTQQISSAFLINGLISLPFYLTVGLIGIIAFIAIPGTDANLVFPALINEVMPVGIKGLILAGLAAIFMSTVDSILNIGSLAIIHDVLGSLTKKNLDPKTELRLMRLASLMIAMGAVLVCHLFSSVTHIVFFLMVLGNSVFFPGFFWGIMGIKASKNGFWIGIAAGALTVLFGTFILELFPLYTMLIAIVLNSCILIIDSLLEKPVPTLPFSSFLQAERKGVIKTMRRNAFFSDSVRNQDYCTVFFVCAIVTSLFPFFFPAIQGLKSFDLNILILNTGIAIISLSMLFRELWWDYVDKLFPIIWILLLTIALPTQSCYMLFKSHMSPVWFVDCLTILPLMLVLTTRSALIVSCGLGVIAALLLNGLSEPILSPENVAGFGYWALVVHITILAICLALFRMRDQESFVITSSTLAHEASRSFLAFENAACYLNNYLPKIIERYRVIDGTEVSPGALDELLALPSQLEQAAKRSRYVIEKLSFSSMTTKAHFEEFNILTSIYNAINDPSIKNNICEKISVINVKTMTIKGDVNQITQVFINLLENAYHATINIKNSKIYIHIFDDYIIVKDTGEGIDKFDMPNIFDNHFSTKATRGQGLAFCKGIMKNHGGTISCSSIRGEFTEFRLNFPTIKNG